METKSASTVVLGKDGLRGHIQAASPASKPEDNQVLVALENGRQALVPKEALRLQEDGSYFLPLSLAELEQVPSERPQESTPVLVVPVLREELAIEKRHRETGRARITKTVHEREEVVDEPLMREEVAIERVPIHQLWDGPAPSLRYEGETMIVPLLEEVLVVEKRLMLKEELHIRKQQTTVHTPQTVTLRNEEVQIERIEPGS